MFIALPVCPEEMRVIHIQNTLVLYVMQGNLCIIKLQEYSVRRTCCCIGVSKRPLFRCTRARTHTVFWDGFAFCIRFSIPFFSWFSFFVCFCFVKGKQGIFFLLRLMRTRRVIIAGHSANRGRLPVY